MNIEISTTRLDADISKIQEQIDNLDNAVLQVYRCLETLNTMWEGPANASFTAQTQLDKIAVESLVATLKHLVACMEFASSEYSRCVEEVNSKIAAIRLENDT